MLLHPRRRKERRFIGWQHREVGVEDKEVVFAIAFPAMVNRAFQGYLAFSDVMASSKGYSSIGCAAPAGATTEYSSLIISSCGSGQEKLG